MSVLLLFATRHRILTFLIILATTAFLGQGILKLRIDTRLELLLDHDGPQYQLYQEAMQTFGSDNKTVFFIRDANLFSPAKLEVLQALVDEIDALEQVESVDSLFSLTSIRNRDDSLESRVVLDVLPQTQAEADAAREDALYSPLLRGNVVGDRGDVTALTVTIRPPLATEKDLDGETYQAFKEITDRYSDKFDELFDAGNLRVGHDLRAYLMSDITRLGPIAVAVLFLTVGLLLRNITMSLIPVFTSVLSTIWTFGFMGHVDIPVNLLTAILPALLLVIGATEDIHLSSAFLEAYDKDEAKDRNAAVHYMAGHMATAVIITASTTAIGFVSNIFSNLIIIQHFAAIACFGILANAVVTFLSVPPLLSHLGPHPKKGGVPGAPDSEKKSFNLLTVLANFCVRYLYDATAPHPRLVTLVVAALLVGSGFLLLKISVNTDPMTFFPQDSPIVRQTNEIADNLSGVLVFFITIDADEAGAFYEPENLDKVNKLVRHINEEGVFDRAMAFTEHLSLVNQELNGGDPAYFEPPDNRDMIEQYLLFFQRSDLEPYVNSDASVANIVVRYSIYGSEKALEEISKLETSAKAILGPDLTTNVLGKYILVNDSSRQLVNNELKAVLFIVVVIFAVMWLLYGSWRAGLVSLIPNLMPIVFTFAVMVIVGIEINPATAMVASVVIGVAIDDTTHLLTRFNTERRKSDDMQLVIQTVIRAEAVPVVASSLALCAGFSVLVLSEFTLTREFGFLAAIAMLFALATEFVVTPILLRNLWVVNIWDLIAVRLPMDRLRNAPLFAGMSRFQIRRLVLLCRELSIDAGENLKAQGDVGEEMFVVIGGDVRLHYEDGSSEYRGVGDVVGEVGFSGDVMRTATIKAVSDTQLLVLDHNSISHRLRHYPYIAQNLNRNMARALGYQLSQSANSQQV